VIAFHKSILDAIKTRDPGLARRQLLQHFDHVRERINRYLETIDVKK
jgi:DNA-binding FadR family transcriptional regulator